jgi:hypothetical protein
MTIDDFLAWKEHQKLRYKFNGWEPVAMTGGPIDMKPLAARYGRWCCSFAESRVAFVDPR